MTLLTTLALSCQQFSLSPPSVRTTLAFSCQFSLSQPTVYVFELEKSLLVADGERQRTLTERGLQ